MICEVENRAGPGGVSVRKSIGRVMGVGECERLPRMTLTWTPSSGGVRSKVRGNDLVVAKIQGDTEWSCEL